MTYVNPLACGGKGPCCHIGYAHRHCEHCDMVVATQPWLWWQPLGTARPYLPAIGPSVTVDYQSSARATAASPEHACEVH